MVNPAIHTYYFLLQSNYIISIEKGETVYMSVIIMIGKILNQWFSLRKVLFLSDTVVRKLKWKIKEGNSVS